MNEPHIRWLTTPHQEKVDLAVLIVSWNVKDLVLKNLERLFESQGIITAECIIIDNASQDGTVEAIRKDFPQVHVIANQENLGFAQANNQGIALMNARHCLLLNPDMAVELDALQKTVEYLDEHSDVAVVGGRLSAPDGKIVKSVRRFPDFWSQLIILLKLPHLFPHLLDHYLWTDFDYEREQAAEAVRGSYFAIHKEALKQFGGLDTRYFIWFEEVDYCQRVTKCGWKVMYVPTIHATDYVGQSFRQTRLFVSQKRMTRSLIAYFKKWHPGWQAIIFEVLRPPLLLVAWLTDQVLWMMGCKDYRRADT